MKRSSNTRNQTAYNVKPDGSIEGIVVAVTNIFESYGERNGKYWTALICESNQSINRITKYLSSKTRCCLHEKMLEYLSNKSGIKLNKLKFSGDSMYTATNETVAAPKPVSFTPMCTQLSLLQDVESMSDGQYVSFICKIIDVRPDDTVIFNNGLKRVQKLKRTTIVADKTCSLHINIWENQFDSIKQDHSYEIKLAKTKIFNNDVSITTTVHTVFEKIDDIGDIKSSDSVHVVHESTATGIITSIGLVEETLSCPNCQSNEIENNGNTVKCLSCNSRTICNTEPFERNKLKLTILDTDKNLLDLTIETSKVYDLLDQCNHKELCKQDLIEQELVLLTLSSIDVQVVFHPNKKSIYSIIMVGAENNKDCMTSNEQDQT